MKKCLGPSPNKGSLFNFGADLISLEQHSTNIDCKAQGAEVLFFNLVIFFLALCGYFRRIRLSIVNSNNSIKILCYYVGMLVLCSSSLLCHAVLLKLLCVEEPFVTSQ